MTTPSNLIPVPETTSESEDDNASIFNPVPETLSEPGEPSTEPPVHGDWTSSFEDQVFDRLWARLRELVHGGHLDPYEELRRWERPWRDWSDSWYSQDDWRANDWKNYRWYDRPYVSHFDPSKFDGRREKFSRRLQRMLNPTTPKAPWNTRPYETGEDDLDPEQDDQADEELGQTAYVDEEGWFYADKDTIHAVDEIIACEDEYFAQMLINYRAARDALAHARIEHGFFPVEVPADDGRQPRFSQTNKTGVKKTGTPTSAYVSRTNAVPGTSSGSTFMNTTPGKSSSSTSMSRKKTKKRANRSPFVTFVENEDTFPETVDTDL